MILYSEEYRETGEFHIHSVIYNARKHTYKFNIDSWRDKFIPAEVTKDRHYLRFMDNDGQYKYIPFRTMSNGQPVNMLELNRIGSSPIRYIDRRFFKILQQRFLNKVAQFSYAEKNFDNKLTDIITFKIKTLKIRTQKSKIRGFISKDEYFSATFELEAISKVFNRLNDMRSQDDYNFYLGVVKRRISSYMEEEIEKYFGSKIYFAMKLRLVGTWYN